MARELVEPILSIDLDLRQTYLCAKPELKNIFAYFFQLKVVLIGKELL